MAPEEELPPVPPSPVDTVEPSVAPEMPVTPPAASKSEDEMTADELREQLRRYKKATERQVEDMV